MRYLMPAWGDDEPTQGLPRPATKSRCKPGGKSRHLVLVPPGSRIAVDVVGVQRRGCEHGTLAMRVRLPPATRRPRAAGHAHQREQWRG